MVVKKSIIGQIENRNFLSPTGFQFTMNRAPKVSYFGNSVSIPSISLGVANFANYLKDIPLPGDKMEFGDLSIRISPMSYLTVPALRLMMFGVPPSV